MLSYQHAYHAGNPADVLKHAVWAELLSALVAKAKPLSIYETHAGRGSYPLSTPETSRGGEYLHGIGKLPLAQIAGAYGTALKSLNPQGALKVIPGSPSIAAALMRPTDNLHLCELHPTEQAHLYAWLRRRPAIHIHATDGLVHTPSLLKAGQRNAVLIDPSYELLTEYAAVVATTEKILHKNPQATVAIWLPLLGEGKAKGQHQRVIDALKALNQQASFLAQWRWNETFPGFALTGSAMVILNLPYGLEQSLPPVLTSLAGMLGLKRPQQTYTLLTPRD